MRAQLDSSKDGSSNPIEKVRICAGSTRSAMSATTELESMPPERNTPSGTSLTNRRSHRGAESGAKFAGVLGFRAPGPMLREVQVPVTTHLHPPLLPHQHVGRRQLAHSRQDAVRRRHVFVGQVAP